MRQETYTLTNPTLANGNSSTGHPADSLVGKTISFVANDWTGASIQPQVSFTTDTDAQYHDEGTPITSASAKKAEIPSECKFVRYKITTIGSITSLVATLSGKNARAA